MMTPRANLIFYLLLLGSPGLAWAQQEPGLQLNAGYTLQSDSNLYRLSDSANTLALLGQDTRSDRIDISTVGLSFNKSYSLQSLELSASLVDYRYQNFSQLSFTAINYNAAWRWAFTPRLHGSLVSERKETLNNFADYRGYDQSNQRTDSDTGLDADYELGGPWHLVAGASQFKRVNHQSLAADSDYSSNNTDLGVRHVLATGSEISLRVVNTNGSYLNRTPSESGLYDDGFSQRDTELRVRWLIDDKIRADLNAAHIERSHNTYSPRNYSGLNAGIRLQWSASAKTALNVSWSRELSSYQTSYSNYAQSDRLAMGPSWQITAKTLLNLRYELSHIDYLGSPTTSDTLQRNDSTRDASISLDWQPYQRLNLSATLQNSQRESSLPGLDYTSNSASLSVQYSF